MEITIKVKNKIASEIDSTPIVCGNTNYRVNFVLDEEWDDCATSDIQVFYTIDGDMQEILEMKEDYIGKYVTLPLIETGNSALFGIKYESDTLSIYTTSSAVVRLVRSIEDYNDRTDEYPYNYAINYDDNTGALELQKYAGAAACQTIQTLNYPVTFGINSSGDLIYNDESGYIAEPLEEGDPGQVLTTDGDGGRQWTTVSSGTTDHANLTNLSYSASGHTGFQAEISDLADIRSKANTALQSVPSTYRTAEEQDAIHDATKVDEPATIGTKGQVLSIGENNTRVWTTITPSGVETDPVFTASAAHGITPDDITSWNNKVESSSMITTNISTAWEGSSAPYTQDISVTGVTSTNIIEVLPSVTITSTELEAFQKANIQDGGQDPDNGTITLKAFGTKPTIAIPIRIIVRGDL